MGKVKEPASTYYSRPMLNALRNHIKDRIEQQDHNAKRHECKQRYIIGDEHAGKEAQQGKHQY